MGYKTGFSMISLAMNRGAAETTATVVFEVTCMQTQRNVVTSLSNALTEDSFIIAVEEAKQLLGTSVDVPAAGTITVAPSPTASTTSKSSPTASATSGYVMLAVVSFVTAVAGCACGYFFREMCGRSHKVAPDSSHEVTPVNTPSELYEVPAIEITETRPDSPSKSGTYDMIHSAPPPLGDTGGKGGTGGSPPPLSMKMIMKMKRKGGKGGKGGSPPPIKKEPPSLHDRAGET